MSMKHANHADQCVMMCNQTRPNWGTRTNWSPLPQETFSVSLRALRDAFDQCNLAREEEAEEVTRQQVDRTS